MDAVAARRPRRHVRRQPGLVRRRDRDPRRARRRAAARRADRRRACASGSRRWRRPGSEVRGLGPMLAIELPEQTGEETRAHHRGRARAGAHAALVRPLRQRDPHPRAVHDRRRASSSGASTSWRAALAADGRRRGRVEGVRKTYGDVVAVDDVDLTVGDGEFFTLLGPSGSGQDDDAAHDRRLRAARRGPRRARRRGHHATRRRTRATSTPSSRTTRSSRT